MKPKLTLSGALHQQIVEELSAEVSRIISKARIDGRRIGPGESAVWLSYALRISDAGATCQETKSRKFMRQRAPSIDCVRFELKQVRRT